jgi:hypothetical protein
MTKREVTQSLKMFEKFLKSEMGLEIAHRYSNDIKFELDEIQTIPLTSKGNEDEILYPQGKYYIYIKISHPFNSHVMITWKNIPSKEGIEKDLTEYLPYFGFTNQVGIRLV